LWLKTEKEVVKIMMIFFNELHYNERQPWNIRKAVSAGFFY